MPAHVVYELTKHPKAPPRIGLLFSMHTETANVWSHLVAAVWATWRVCEVRAEPNVLPVARLYMQFFFLGAVVCFTFSALAHLLGGGTVLPPAQRHLIWRIDQLGICILMLSSYAPALRWGFRCRPWTRRAYFTVIAAPLIGGLVFLMASQGRRRSLPQAQAYFVGCMCFTVGFSLVPLFHWASFAPPADRLLLGIPCLVQIIIYTLGFVFYRWRPLEVLAHRMGRPTLFDLAGSHLVWHILVVAAVATWDTGGREMIKRRWDENSCEQ